MSLAAASPVPAAGASGIFRRIVVTALIAGLVGGLALSIGRQAFVVPLILDAEVYEQAAEHQHPGHDHAAMAQGAPAPAQPAEKEWEPADGLERNAWTWAANGLTGFGFALLLVAGFVLSGRPVNVLRGLLWGVAGFAVFSLAPAIGLPPALPGAPEVALVPRQLWWLCVVIGAASGLALLVFGASWWRWLGLLLIVLPHPIPAPHNDEPLIAPLVALTQRFIVSTLAVNGVFWLVLGAVGGWLWSRQASRRSA